MNKKLLLFLLITGIVACNYSCDKKYLSREKSMRVDSVANRLESDAFYADSIDEYRQLFFDNYTAAVKNGNFADAKELLVAYGNAASVVYDSSFMHTSLDFINNKYSGNADSQYAKICHFISWNFFMKGDMPNTAYWAKRSIAACNFPNAQRTLSYGYHDLAGYYLNTNQVDSAIDYFSKTVKVYEDIKDSASLASAYFNIGGCYYGLFAYNESMRYVRKACVIDSAIRDTTEWVQDEMFFPVNSGQFGQDTATTIKQTERILNIYKHFTAGTLTDTFLIHILSAKKNLLEKNYGAAAVHLAFCSRADTTGIDYMLTSYLDELNIENEFAVTGHLSDPDEYKIKAEELSKKGSLFDASLMYALLAENALQNKDLSEYKEMKKIENAYRDSVYQNNIKGQVLEIDKKYQTAQKQNRIDLQQQTIHSKTRTIEFLIASVISLILIGFVVYLVQRQKKLKQEKQNSIQYTRQLLEKTEEERKRIASDLHDSVSHELINLKSVSRTEFEKLHSGIDNIINDIRIISRNLHPVLFERIGLAGTIEQMVERVQQQNNFLLTADINYNDSLPQTAALQVYRIIQESITNMVKYANALAGKVSISEDQENVVVEIKDNGKGFNVTEILNSKNSFGLHNIIERSRAIGGEAKIISGKDGTIIKIEIPKNSA